jgi:hypothetical protein
MIVELRTYTLHPGKLGEFLGVYLPEPFDLQKRILGNLLGYYTTEAGTLNQLVHLWGYQSFEERLQRRAALMKEPVWQAYVPKGMACIQLMESKLLLPTAFSPVK